MKAATLCFLVKDDAVLLGMKKRGFGAGKWNGFGGKVQAPETIAEAALRELQEESGIVVKPKHLNKIAELTFLFPQKPEWDMIVHVFVAQEWQGLPQESEEMQPRWFSFVEIPFGQMWADDPYWLPLVLQRRMIKGTFVYAADNASVQEYHIEDDQYL